MLCMGPSVRITGFQRVGSGKRRLCTSKFRSGSGRYVPLELGRVEKPTVLCLIDLA